MRSNLRFSIVLIFSVAGIGAAIAAILGNLVSLETPEPYQTSAPPSSAGEAPGKVLFNPPRPDAAPENMREAVMYGYRILKDTRKYAPQYVGNKLNCTNCHFDAGMERKTLSLVGVAAKYPKYRKRSGYSTDLVERTNGCFRRSMNGKPVPPESREMQAMMAYYHWISKGLPIYAEIPWLGLKPLESTHEPDAARGKQVFARRCAHCHGRNGEGTVVAPPLWGSGSFSDGASMSTISDCASFVHSYMPKGNPDLTVPQALDAAAFVTSQPRPHFREKEDPDDVW